MDEVLAESIKSLPETPESDLDLNRINLLWGLVVGEEIGSRSRVVKMSKSTLFVEVKGQEWVPVLHTYERKILNKLNKIFDSKDFTGIMVQQVEGIPLNSNKPLKISAPPSHNQPMDKHTVAREEHLKSITDPGLRERLARLSTKLRFVTLALVSILSWPIVLRCNPPPIPKRCRWMPGIRCPR